MAAPWTLKHSRACLLAKRQYLSGERRRAAALSTPFALNCNPPRRGCNVSNDVRLLPATGHRYLFLGFERLAPVLTINCEKLLLVLADQFFNPFNG
jgi:hypothetical protein